MGERYALVDGPIAMLFLLLVLGISRMLKSAVEMFMNKKPVTMS